jgi:hypothetical protein
MLNVVSEDNLRREAFHLEQPEPTQQHIEDQQSEALEALRLWLARVPRSVGPGWATVGRARAERGSCCTLAPSARGCQAAVRDRRQRGGSG